MNITVQAKAPPAEILYVAVVWLLDVAQFSAVAFCDRMFPVPGIPSSYFASKLYASFAVKTGSQLSIDPLLCVPNSSVVYPT
jgi:hypothetical protein